MKLPQKGLFSWKAEFTKLRLRTQQNVIRKDLKAKIKSRFLQVEYGLTAKLKAKIQL